MRRSKLAKENDISNEEEAEIKEAFKLFAGGHDDYEEEKDGVIPTEDVRRALQYGPNLLEKDPSSHY